MVKKQDLGTSLASSIMYFDKEETEKFLQGYDSAVEQKMSFDARFEKFVAIIRKFKNYEDEENLYENKSNFILNSIEVMPSTKTREKFKLWFDDVLLSESEMQLADDIRDRLMWESYKERIAQIDNQEITFAEKLNARPIKLETNADSTKLVNLLDIDMTEENNSLDKYTTGLEDLDKLVSMSETNFVVIAARPGVGKSLFMIQSAIANAEKGVKSLLISLEMNEKSINERIINHVTNKDIREMNTDEYGNLDTHGYNLDILSATKSADFKQIAKHLQILVIKESSADSIMEQIEDQIKENHYKAVFLDYLQLLRYTGIDEWASIRAATKELKNMAFRYEVCIVTGSQVSRSSTERGLDLAQLFGSSSIESDTDIVIGLEAAQERRQGQDSIIFVKILKNREGDIGSIKYSIDYSTGTLNVVD